MISEMQPEELIFSWNQMACSNFQILKNTWHTCNILENNIIKNHDVPQTTLLQTKRMDTVLCIHEQTLASVCDRTLLEKPLYQSHSKALASIFAVSPLIATPCAASDTVNWRRSCQANVDSHFVHKDMCLQAPLHTRPAAYVLPFHMFLNTVK